MADGRSDAQAEADKCLHEAIQLCAQAYGRLEPDEMLTEWVVLIGGSSFDSDGDTVTVTTSLSSAGHIGCLSWHARLGLLRAATLQAEREYTTPDDSC